MSGEDAATTETTVDFGGLSKDIQEERKRNHFRNPHIQEMNYNCWVPRVKPLLSLDHRGNEEGPECWSEVQDPVF